MDAANSATLATEVQAAALLAAIALGLALLCGFLYRRYRKPYLVWWALAWLLYLLRVGAIATFLVTGQRIWLYWHQVLTGWTALTLLWAAMVFSRQVDWRYRYAVALLFPAAWSYVAIYQLDNFLLAAGPAVLFLSLVTLWTGWIFFRYFRQVRSTGAGLLSAALCLWGLHHLDYPFLRARGAWNPWGYYLDILFLLATGVGILVLVQDELRRGLAALSALSGDLQLRGGNALVTLLQRPLTLPAALGSAMIVLDEGCPRYLAGAGTCAEWEGLPLPEPTAEAAAAAIRTRKPRFPRDWPDPRRESSVSFPYAAILPVLRDGAGDSALVVVGNARDPFTALDEGYLRALGAQIGAALENVDLNERLRARTAELARLSAGMTEQHESERRRLSLELHDETAQVFTAVKLQLGVLREHLDPELARSLSRTVDLVDTGMQSIRRVTGQLRPSLLDDLGLLPALRSLADAFADGTGVLVALDAPRDIPPVNERVELALFRAMQEALANIAQHADARQVTVRVMERTAQLVLEVEDDGRGLPTGFDIEHAERDGHLGLAGMRERLAALGGTLELAEAAPRGVIVRVSLPLAPTNSA